METIVFVAASFGFFIFAMPILLIISIVLGIVVYRISFKSGIILTLSVGAILIYLGYFYLTNIAFHTDTFDSNIINSLYLLLFVFGFILPAYFVDKNVRQLVN